MTELSIQSDAAQLAGTQGSRSASLAEWRAGFPVVITSFFGLAIAVLSSWSIGLFIEPIQKETGWGRGEISAGLIMVSIVGFCAAPFVGRLIDKIGVRKVGLVGMVVYCLAFSLLGTSGGQLWQWWGMWLFLAIGYVLVKPTLWAVAVSQRFDVHRGLALAVTMSGSGVLLIVMPAIVTALIADYGWRMSYAILGGGSALLTLPLMVLFLRDRKPLPVADDARATEAEDAADAASAKAELWAALLSKRFICLLLVAVLVTIAIIGLQVHFIPLLVEKGADRATAAMITGMIGVGSITGRLTCGFLMDRTRGQRVAALFFALPAISSIFLLSYDGNVVVGCAIAFTQGLALGAEIDVMTFLVSRYFGLRNYGTLVGTVVGFLIVGNGVGPTIAGWVFDVTGSYQLFVIAVIPIFLLCSLLIGTLGDYPRHAR
ncbi:MAG: MFS transporter, partial [Alphaproteobacteria bacterium]|nr:MFS transporter [Alphaproteobacteria bacterium]